ncbi:ribosomal protein subunit L25 [Schizosaccharomyces japonicus yFS275]|uniref:Ribosomal protein subunit L25 n=1 Tax=Schizosaccharomyces japonicus (strain yFS275 / FY16936) TaxID=402676 RepID=B6K140_SCHJY|nr:ribosomal protein subunit L25 [Schizosaccharomyces japonicus yFS275]EEB07661.2 ribosomal protein subunit L25 [Schizosaccharomyces japonicus yFS275]
MKLGLKELPAKLRAFFAKFPPETEKAWSLGTARPNPFLPAKNEITGAWRGPVYSNRKQADLFKLAKMHNLQHLLPRQKTWNGEKNRRIIQSVIRPKGKKFERNKEARQEKKNTILQEALKKTDAFKQNLKKEKALNSRSPI